MKTHIEILAEVTGLPADYIDFDREVPLIIPSEALEAMRIAVEQANGWVSVEDNIENIPTMHHLLGSIDNTWVEEMYYDGTNWYLSGNDNQCNPTHYMPKPAPPIK